MFARKAIAVIVCALLAVPVLGQPPETLRSGLEPVGNVVSARSAVIGNAGAASGTTLFSGETVEVGERGGALLALRGGAQVRLAEKSRVQLVRTEGAIELDIAYGRVQFRTSANTPVIGRLADGTLRPRGAEPAVGVIALLTPSTAIVGAEKGVLTFTTAHDGKSVDLKEGEAVTVRLAQATGQQEPTPTATTKEPLNRKRTAQIAIITTAVVVGVGLALVGVALSDSEKRNLVSPFQFP
jgi:hypothetical protein